MDEELRKELETVLNPEVDLEYDVYVVIEKTYRVSVMAKHGAEARHKVGEMQTTQIYKQGKDISTEVTETYLLD